MSGIAGIYHLDQSPITAQTLSEVVERLKRRGPDQQHTWIQGALGLVHAALLTTPQELNNPQPLTIDGNLWITSDCRIDNRDELILQFTRHHFSLKPDPSDSQLIAFAFKLWGDECVAHLLGDFAFVLWDVSRQRLFCARDHFGVKPLYYFHEPGKLFAVASEIRPLLSLPQIPEAINEARIADYLVQQLEGYDQVTTLYQGIYRLPPAHVLTVENGNVQQRQYWKLEPPQPIHLSSDGEYAEAYLEQLTRAVMCRLRTASAAQIGSMLSGGLDSSSIVGISREWLNRSMDLPLKTFSAMSECGQEDEETRHSMAVMAQGGLDTFIVKPNQLPQYTVDFEYLSSHTTNLFTTWMQIPQLMYIEAKRQRVKILLDGVFGDELTTLGQWYIGAMLRSGHWRSAIREAVGYSNFYGGDFYPARRILFQEIGRSFLPLSLRSLVRKFRLSKRRKNLLARTIINREFATQQQVPERLDHLSRSLDTSDLWQAAQHQALWFNHPYLTAALERYDEVAAAHSIEPRHPYLDKRLVEFCLALPLDQKMRAGWTKYVARKAVQRMLPEEVCWRKGKDQLTAEFMQARLRLERQRIEKVAVNDVKLVGKYIDSDRFHDLFASYQAKNGILNEDYSQIGSLWEATALIIWLKNRGP